MRFLVLPLIVLPSIANAADVAAARAAVGRALKDPASARFEGVRDRGAAVCGLVNAKNSLGGYTGAMPFVYVVASREVFVLDPASQNGPAWAARAVEAYQAHCS